MVIVSHFCQNNGLVVALSQLKNKHHSEIQAVQELLGATPQHNQVFTWDALHCQKPTIQQIVKSGNDYLVAVKKNQPRLYNCLETVVKTTTPIWQYCHEAHSHGRRLTRKVSVLEILQNLAPVWANACRCLPLQRSGYRG